MIRLGASMRSGERTQGTLNLKKARLKMVCGSNVAFTVDQVESAGTGSSFEASTSLAFPRIALRRSMVAGLAEPGRVRGNTARVDENKARVAGAGAGEGEGCSGFCAAACRRFHSASTKSSNNYEIEWRRLRASAHS